MVFALVGQAANGSQPSTGTLLFCSFHEFGCCCPLENITFTNSAFKKKGASPLDCPNVNPLRAKE